MRRFWMIAIAVSLLIHMAFVLYLPSEAVPTISPTPEKMIKISLVKKEARPNALKGAGRSQLKAGPSATSKNHVTTQNPVKSYSQLMDRSAAYTTASPGDLPVRGPYVGDKKAQIEASATDFSAHFDLPLIFRRDIHEGRAWAYIVQDHDGLLLDVLAGNPLVRAALFESLNSKDIKPRLRSLFRMFQTSRVKITIEYATETAMPNELEFQQNYETYENEVVIKITRFLKTPHYGVTGMVISDEHARKAERRDRDHAARLRASAAYRGTVDKVRL